MYCIIYILQPYIYIQVCAHCRNTRFVIIRAIASPRLPSFLLFLFPTIPHVTSFPFHFHILYINVLPPVAEEFTAASSSSAKKKVYVFCFGSLVPSNLNPNTSTCEALKAKSMAYASGRNDDVPVKVKEKGPRYDLRAIVPAAVSMIASSMTGM